MLHLPNEGYLLGGYTNSTGNGGKDFYLVKVNQFYETVWEQTYGETYDESITSLCETSGHKFIFAGLSTDLAKNYAYVTIVNTDRFGREEWKRKYTATPKSIVSRIIPTTDGGLCACRYARSQGRPRFKHVAAKN
ncbi:MAG: hypothetical protein HC896_07430 [Bacteroidales bacterium]|nr:hypothetical protein [Bacteroidales bacterium]